MRKLTSKNIRSISVAFTHYLFRNGPVENMHADGKLTQDDMKTLNKYMVDRIAGLCELFNNGNMEVIDNMINYYSTWGSEWDEPNPDTHEIITCYNRGDDND